MAYRLPVNEPVAVRIKFADLVASQYGSQVKLKCLVDGAEEHVYLPGAGLDVLTQLHEAGVIGAIPAAVPERDTHGIALDVRARDVVLELAKASPKAPGRLVVTARDVEATAPLPHARSSPSAPRARTAPANPATSASAEARPDAAPPAPSTLADDPRARCQARRQAVTKAFREAMETAGTELLPIFAAHDIAIDGETFFKLSLSPFSAWRESRAVSRAAAADGGTSSER